MKTILAIIGGAAIFVILVGVILIATGLNQLKPLIADATQYADESIVEIATDWDADALRRRAAPELMTEMPDDALNALMAFGDNQLGALTEATSADCLIVNYHVSTDEGKVVQATCTARAEHEKGAASYELNLVNRNDAWALFGFFVAPDELKSLDADEPRFVAAEPTFSVLNISLRSPGIGVSTNDNRLPVGAGVRDFEKIENVN